MKHILSVNVPGEAAPHEFTLEKALTTVGRSAQNDIQLKVEEISTRHMELHLVEGSDKIRLVDLGSTNGTTVNGVSVVECEVSPGEAIVIGDTLKAEIELLADAVEVAPAVPVVSEAAPAGSAPTMMLRKAPAPALGAPKLATPAVAKPAAAAVATPKLATPAARNPLGRPAVGAPAAKPALATPAVAKPVPTTGTPGAKPMVSLQTPAVAKPAAQAAPATAEPAPLTPRKLAPPSQEPEEAPAPAAEAPPVAAPALATPKVAGKPSLNVPKTGEPSGRPKLNLG